ncbi:hypothetical protein [Methylibium sp.]|uniref:hypothetical protein n=1 Tax=Methylibium sp. TaxID=2067992 RepID=UPI003D0B7EE6
MLRNEGQEMTDPKGKPASLAARIRKFFLDNPDEEMTYELLTAKFGAHHQTVRDAVRVLRDEGLLEALHVVRRVEKGRAS